ncbi:hypothetical protein Scep_024208 [Stephania cephalantha]|uniref:Uncharacterized protein n=1 Tax=Stephania cephalantha TaxID=152367 RepID=A0AAP0F393_9MAGN
MQWNHLLPMQLNWMEKKGWKKKENENKDSDGEDREGGEGDKEGSGSGSEGEEGEDSKEEVIEVRPSAKARGKAKSGPSDKVAADESSKPFPGGPINQKLLTSFNNHVAAAIWNKKCDTIGRFEAVELVCSALDMSEKEAEQQINKELKFNKAWLKGKWGRKPTSSLSGKEMKMSVDVIKAWKALPPHESNKAAVVKMADAALKLMTMFGSPTPSQPIRKPVEGVPFSKRKLTTLAPLPSQQKREKARI